MDMEYRNPRIRLFRLMKKILPIEYYHEEYPVKVATVGNNRVYWKK
ncbi:hypothetical protein [Pseudoneobacillus sp. C159]